MIKATIITIGDELLIGQTIDTNSAWIAQQLNILGIDVLRRVAVGDNYDDIYTAIDDEFAKANLLILTGGLGPTADDITKPLLCRYFNSKLVVNKQVEDRIMSIFQKRNLPMLERNLKQAEVPDNCEILPNSAGTAAGMWFEKDDKVLIALPGVPHEMKTIMQEHGLIKIAHTFISETILHKTMLTAGVGESFIAEKIADIEQELPPYIKLAYLPEYGMVRLRLTAKGQDEVALYSALNKYFNAIINRLGMIVIAHEDLTMPQLVVRELIQRKKTIALAESCTGGLLGHLLTQEPGASAAFIGSVVAYSNEIKTNILKVKASTIQTYGVVSEPTVREMVHGILQEYQTDYGIAISGVLGPGGGTDRVQVGTVCIAVGNNERKFTKTFKFDKDRTLNKDLAAKMALLLLWQLLNNRL